MARRVTFTGDEKEESLRGCLDRHWCRCVKARGHRRGLKSPSPTSKSQVSAYARHAIRADFYRTSIGGPPRWSVVERSARDGGERRARKPAHCRTASVPRRGGHTDDDG
jgi:hypothetical protein